MNDFAKLKMTGAAIELNNNSSNGTGGVETAFERTRSSSRTSVSSGSSSHSDSSEEGETVRDDVEKENENEKVSK